MVMVVVVVAIYSSSPPAIPGLLPNPLAHPHQIENDRKKNRPLENGPINEPTLVVFRLPLNIRLLYRIIYIATRHGSRFAVLYAHTEYIIIWEQILPKKKIRSVIPKVNCS
jgi:hypothetical protein